MVVLFGLGLVLELVLLVDVLLLTSLVLSELELE